MYKDEKRLIFEMIIFYIYSFGGKNLNRIKIWVRRFINDYIKSNPFQFIFTFFRDKNIPIAKIGTNYTLEWIILYIIIDKPSHPNLYPIQIFPAKTVDV